MRRRAKIDANQPLIVRALRQMGCSVQSLAEVGNGTPDLLVGYSGLTFLVEVKDGEKKPSEQRLTEDEHAWHLAWLGMPVIVAKSQVDAITEIQNAVIARNRKC